MKLKVDNLGKVAITVEQGYWDISKDYDKLTVVQQQNAFATYISRKPVPAGIVLTNRIYWIPFSSLKEDIVINYNSFIERYGEILRQHSNKINQLITDVDSLKSIQNNVTETLNIAQQANTNAQAALNAANKALESLGNSAFSSIGEGLEINNKTLSVKKIDSKELDNILI